MNLISRLKNTLAIAKDQLALFLALLVIFSFLLINALIIELTNNKD